MSTETTKVIFRKFNDEEVIAFFPELPSDCNGYYCQSYMHCGQHGGADPELVYSTKPAKPAEYADLIEELEQIGYNLKIAKRMTSHDFTTRKQSLKKITS